MAITYTRSKFTVGTGTPASNSLTGTAGDVYLDSSTGNVYNYTSVWMNTSIVGKYFMIHVGDSYAPLPNIDQYTGFWFYDIEDDVEIQNPTGTPYDGMKIEIRLKDDGGSRPITWASKYRALTGTLPSLAATVTILTFVYNLSQDKWDTVL